MKPKFRSRGEYRPFYASIIDDPDFQSMSSDAFKAFFVLRMMLGAAGIGIVRPALALESLAWEPARLDAAMRELEKPKPGRQYGWIVREGRLVWIVNALHFEPTLSPDNKLHRKFVRRSLDVIGDVPIRARFESYYPEWIAEPDEQGKGSTKGQERVSKPHTTPDLTKPDQTSASSARAREAVPEEFRPDVDRLLSRAPNQEAWAAEIAASTNGAHKGRGPVPTADQLGRAIRDFNANAEEPKLALFRGYLRRATAEPVEGSVRTQRQFGAKRANAGEQQYANSKRALEDISS